MTDYPMYALIGIGSVLLGVALGSWLVGRPVDRRLMKALRVVVADPTPPTTAELNVGVRSRDARVRDVVIAAKSLGQFSDLADDLDYYASKTTGGTASDGYEDAAVKIREVIDGTYLRGEQ